jgi:hypothetical protein
MSFETEKAALEAKFTDWTDTRVKYVGKPFLEPATGPYIALNVINGEGQIATLGVPHLRRHVSLVVIQIFDKENKSDGDALIRRLADLLTLKFINANSRLTISATEYLDFGEPSLSSWQVTNGYQQRNLTISYTRDVVL